MALLAAAWALCVQLRVQPSTAQSSERRFSPYEQETVEIVLGQNGEQLEEAPAGKTVEAIEVVPIDVFEPRDPAPQFLNWFHVTTHKEIIGREVLLRVGSPYDPALAAETERNLRGFTQLSVVLVIPIRGSSEDKVRVLVITKDVWSLRVNWEPSFVNGKLTALSLAPAESNLFGTTQTVLASAYFDANNYWLGGRYYVPRIGQSRIRANVGGNAIFNCRTGAFEGATGDFTYGQPLYSSRTRWSWQTSATWSSSLVRSLITRDDQAICEGGVSGKVRYSAAQVVSAEPPNQIVERDELTFPSEYRAERLRGQAVLTRSFNLVNKFNFSTGMELDWRANHRDPVSIEEVERERVRYVIRPDGSVADQLVVEDLPPSREQFDAVHQVYLDPNNLRPRDRRISPYVQMHAFANRYVRLINYNTLGLQEDVQLGHDVYLRLYPAFEPLSTRNLMGIFASAGYTLHSRGALLRTVASSEVEYAGAGSSDVTISAGAHFVTPDVGVGRFVYDWDFVHSPVQYTPAYYVLGGTSRLRGYSTAQLFGTGRAVFNHEFRSRPIRIFSVLTGIALFHDVGGVFFDDLRGFRLRQGAGAGLRILAPQLDRDVFRIDFGFPLVFPPSDDPAAEFTFLATFRQAFSTPVEPPRVLLPQ